MLLFRFLTPICKYPWNWATQGLNLPLSDVEGTQNYGSMTGSTTSLVIKIFTGNSFSEYSTWLTCLLKGPWHLVITTKYIWINSKTIEMRALQNFLCYFFNPHLRVFFEGRGRERERESDMTYWSMGWCSHQLSHTIQDCYFLEV